ncbi:MAG: UDP-glucose/GDP-mannose dehydrogenase family protein [Bdellovibrionales bacterium]
MKIAVVGTGYVGLVTGTCLAEMGNEITCVDVDQRKIELLKDGVIPIYEPGLEELVKSNFAAGRLQFTTQIAEAVQTSEVIMIAVGTPPKEDGSADLKHVLKVAESIGQYMNDKKIVITKSTVPVGTGEKVKTMIASQLKTRNSKLDFSVCSNPEFLKEGTAVGDCMRPDRIVIGCEDEFAKEKLTQMYQPFILNGHRVIFMDIRSAELTKYAANALLATKISFMNEVSRVAEKVGADIAAVRQGIGTDVRIGFHFIYPGIGYGGSCFPKDVKALITTAQENGIDLTILNAVENVNQSQRQFYINKIKTYFKNDLKNKKFAIWGLSFKPETDDIREAPAIDVIVALLQAGASVAAYDPIAGENTISYFSDKENLKTHFPNISAEEIKNRLNVLENEYDVLKNADALLLLTEWKPFRSPDFKRVADSLKKPVIFDGRNLYDQQQMQALGFHYECIGRKIIN